MSDRIRAPRESPADRAQPFFSPLPYLAALCISGFILASVWPGLMTYDSFYMLRQARFGLTDSNHPPFMTLIWRGLDLVYPGPALMLFFNAALFLLSLAHLIDLYSPRRRLTVLILIAVVFFSPLLGPLTTVWKDVTMLAFFTAAAAALAHSVQRGVTWPLAPALIFLLMGTACRHDALAAAVPLFLWWSWRVAHELRIGPRALYLRVGLGFSVISVLSLTSNWALNEAAGGRSKAWVSIALFDLLGTSHYAGINLLPPAATAKHETFTQEDIDRIYSVDHVNHSLSRLPRNTGLKLIHRADPEVVRAAWLHALTTQPASYFRHRLGFALNLIAFTRASVFYPSGSGIAPNDLGITFEPSRLTYLMLRRIQILASSPLAKPWLHYLLALVLVAALVARRTEGSEVPVALLCSAYTCLFAAIMVMPAADLRYQAWSLAAAMSASIVSLLLMARPSSR